MKIVVCIKQVPDTQKVKIDEKTGVMIRDGIESKMNPFDLYALETALKIKEKLNAKITVITMGPPNAKAVIQEAFALGVDEGYLMTDRKFAGADVLATSYTLSEGIKVISDGYDLIICGKQTTDGDTAQVGPQVAEKLGIPQVTYAENIESIEDGKIRIKRRLENGVETVSAELPVLVTVNSSAQVCRPRNAKLLQKYKHAKTVTETQAENIDYIEIYNERPYLNLTEC